MCQHSSLNKGKHGHTASFRATGCMAMINCKIKYVKKSTCKNDSFLKQVHSSQKNTKLTLFLV